LRQNEREGTRAERIAKIKKRYAQQIDPSKIIVYEPTINPRTFATTTFFNVWQFMSECLQVVKHKLLLTSCRKNTMRSSLSVILTGNSSAYMLMKVFPELLTKIEPILTLCLQIAEKEKLI